jgi:hypothetical protein
MLALVFSVMIITYGLSKGFDLIELSSNILYFILVIISQLINLIYEED